MRLRKNANDALKQAARLAAKAEYHEDGSIEIDPDAEVSLLDAGERGAYVCAWVFVERESIEEYL
jgi:hypothetical protein